MSIFVFWLSISLHFNSVSNYSVVFLEGHIFSLIIFCILIIRSLDNEFDSVFWSTRKVILLNIYIYIYIQCKIWLTWNSAQYIGVERCIYCGRKKTNKLPVHPYRHVSWLSTHQGIRVRRAELVVYLSFSSHNMYIYKFIYIVMRPRRPKQYCLQLVI